LVQGAKRKRRMSSSMFVKAMVLKYNALSMDCDGENEHIINWGILGLASTTTMFNTMLGMCSMYIPYLADSIPLSLFLCCKSFDSSFLMHAFICD